MENYHFEGQRANEEVIFVIKRHPWVLASPSFLGIAAVIIIFVGILIFGFSKTTSILIVVGVLYFLVSGAYQWFVYNNYLFILTSERVIIIIQKGLFGRKIIEAELDKIQNITTEIKGPLRTFLNFGDVILRTAGIDPTMVMDNVPNPYEVQQKIIQYCRVEADKKMPPNIIR